MATTNTQSRQIQSLVAFVLDTKPYSRKLTDVGEEYRFTDYMNVSFTEKLFSTTHMNDTWMYSLLSSGTTVPTPRTQLQRSLDPVFRKYTVNDRPDESPGAFKAFRDEDTDLPLVPYAYDPTSIQGVGLSDAFVQRNGSKDHCEPLLEGHDVFLSHGAYVFDVSQVNDASSMFNPLYAERRNQGTISKATAATRLVALDLTNPGSCANVLTNELHGLQAAITATGNPATYADVSTEVVNLLAILAPSVSDPTVANDLPSSYELLVNLMKALAAPDLAALVPDYDDPDALEGRLAAASPSLYFGKWSDLGLRETGLLRYDNLKTDQLVVTGMTAPTSAPQYQEWRLVVDADTSQVQVFGSFSGYIGNATIGMEFTHPLVNFALAPGVIPAVEGTEVRLHPVGGITIHPSCTLDAWSLIKVNPLAYSRPQLGSTRYGHIESSTGALDVIDVIDQTLETSEFILEATSGTTFTMTSPDYPSYSATVTVDVPFNDGKLAFKVVQGTTYTFIPGDRFYIEVTNEPAHSDDFDLYYGYDMGGYDAYESIYTNVSPSDADYLRQLEFGYDSRFVDYDLTAFNLQLAEDSIDGQQWRLRALPDTTKPLNRIQRDTTTSNLFDETELEPTATDPQYDMPNNVTSEGIWSSSDPDTTPDLRLWYATSFALERLDSSGWTQVATVPVGSSYSSSSFGFSFNLAAGNKPFIASRLSSSWYASTTASTFSQENTDGGDVFNWTIINKPPVADTDGLVSSHTPRLIMHGDTFQKDTQAQWALTWLDTNTYTISGISTATANAGAQLYDPLKVISFTDGLSYKDDDLGIHFTVVPGLGGLDAGDVFTFETYGFSPSYLVHSSANGWMPSAQVGQWYFNGMVGFYIEPPEAQVYEVREFFDDAVSEGFYNGLLPESAENVWTTSAGDLTLDYVRPDCPSFNYTIKGSKGEQWMLYRNGELVGAGTDQVKDLYVTISLPTAGSATVGKLFTMSLLGDDRSLSIGRDLAILKATPARLPSADDYLLFERTKANNIRFAIRPVNMAHATTLEVLEPVSIDPRFVNYSAGLTQVDTTSPEIDVLSDWIPILFNRRDGATSEAIFTDPQVAVDITAASTGEAVGTLQNDAAGWGVTWDTGFFSSYMPLNAESVFLTVGSGLNEHFNVNFSETLNILISGGGVDEGFLFNDTINIQVVEDPQWAISQVHEETAAVNLDDTFTGFLQGYDTGGYDFEDQVDGYYDIGYPFSTFFSLAKVLRAKQLDVGLSDTETANLELYTSLVQAYLVDANLDDTTFIEFQAAIEADDLVNRSVYDMFMRAVELKARATLSGPDQAELTNLTTLLTPYVDLTPADVWSTDLQADATQITTLATTTSTQVDALTAEMNNPATTPARRLQITAEINSTIADYNVQVDAINAATATTIATDTAPLKAEFLTNLATLQPESFGFPTSGLAVDTDQVEGDVTGAQIVDAMYLNLNEYGTTYDMMGWGVGGYDKIAYVQATFMVSSYVPLPSVPTGAWVDYETDLTGTGQVIELSFATDIPVPPTVYIWFETEPSPTPVAYLERINTRLFRFGVGQANNFKLAIT
jgi:hypothetical protein